MPLASATIEILDVDKNAVDPSRGLDKTIQVQFNPTEYTLAKGAQIAEIAIPGLDSPILQFIAGQNEKLTLDLFFDTTLQNGMGDDANDVRLQTRSIYQLVKIQPKTHAPPRIRFWWGQGISFVAIVESVQQKFTLFNSQGVPLRATLSVTFREYKTLEEQLQELNLQSADQSKRHVVCQGDTLAGIAAREYGDPAAWRVIADANADVIRNPRRLPTGLVLLLPPADGLTLGGNG
jgi:nucleoid-associated protein YgaU